jgi:hypothetical protein
MRTRTVRRNYRLNSRFGPERLDRLTDEELLDMRICDLGLRIEGTSLEARIKQLHRELEMRGFRFRPHAWLSDDWFTPDGVPGSAVPFFLAHPRLARLEGKQLLEVEGGTEEWCMKILRHEAGHAIDNAYRLRRRKCWRDVFGKASQRYPEVYQPKPYSKRFVLHLDMWYAQAHPIEDFAETFAVWLKPRSRWRSQYRGWLALKKLEFVDELMAEIKAEKPKVACRAHVDSLRTIRKTLREHYGQKRAQYGLDHPDFYDRDLRRLFSENRKAGYPSAASFLRQVRDKLREDVSKWTGEHQYTIDQVLTEMTNRCRDSRLYVDRPADEVERDLLTLVTIQTMNYLHGGHHRVAL